MKYLYTVSEAAEFFRYEAFAARHNRKIHQFLHYLKSEYEVTDLPGAIVWAGKETATQLISNIPLPAYTNEFRTVFCPEIDNWRELYLRQLDDADDGEIRRYYESKLTENHILQILGHEFVHHSELFIDEAYEQARWFEEGMCEYISRRYFLSDSEFRETVRIHTRLVEQFETRCGAYSLERFCADSYSGSICEIFYFYWRSFLAVNRIVEQMGNNVAAVFREYRRWYDGCSSLPLSKWFHI